MGNESHKPLSTTHTLVLLALVASVTLLATLFLKVQTPTGYIHLGDGVIYGAALAFGPVFAAVAGALGSSLADVLGGYIMWAPWTFVIKGVAGYIIGRLCYLNGSGQLPSRRRQILAMTAGAIWTVAGYALGTSIMYSPGAALGESLGNLVQTGSGIIVGLFLGPMLKASLRNQKQ